VTVALEAEGVGLPADERVAIQQGYGQYSIGAGQASAGEPVFLAGAVSDNAIVHTMCVVAVEVVEAEHGRVHDTAPDLDARTRSRGSTTAEDDLCDAF
jgi:hypothetical protein